MSVSIIIISHEAIGQAYLNTLKQTFNAELPLSVSTVEVQADSDPENLVPELRTLTKSLDQGDGVLILTDLFGATPFNISNALHDDHIKIVTGLNLPMLMRILNYPHKDLLTLAEIAVKGGQDGIKLCQMKSDHA